MILKSTVIIRKVLFFLGLSFPNVYTIALNIYEILPFLHVSGSQWKSGEGSGGQGGRFPFGLLGTFLLTFNLSSFSNLLREDFQVSFK